MAEPGDTKRSVEKGGERGGERGTDRFDCDIGLDIGVTLADRDRRMSARATHESLLISCREHQKIICVRTVLCVKETKSEL